MPGYWMYETTGVLRPAIEAYLLGKGEMTPEHIAAMRAYLRQWINAPGYKGVEVLRWRLNGLTSREAIDEWLEIAAEMNIDPL